MSLNKSNSFNNNFQAMFKEHEELINKNDNNLNVTLLIIGKEKLVSSFKSLFSTYRMDNQISEKYTKNEIHTNISFILNTDDYFQLDDFIHLITVEHRNIHDFIINNKNVNLIFYFSALYVSLLNDSNYIVYNVKHNTSNYKTKYILKKGANNKYIVQEDYYSLYRGEYLYSDSGELKEMQKEEAMELIFYSLDKVSIHHK